MVEQQRRSRLAAGLLRLLGWRLEVTLPEEPSYVLVVAPHTSNWDFFYGYAAKMAVGLDLFIMAKHTLFRGPLGHVLRRLGVIPVDRRAAHGVIGQMAETFRRSERLVLAITPEGTRSRTTYWKPGFYHIARDAGVPIALAFLDYRGKRVGIGGVVYPSGDINADMASIRAFYSDKYGRRPQEQGEVRLRPADRQDASA